jgi:hypothetical protein
VIVLQIKENNVLNDKFDCSYDNLGTSMSIEEIGKLGIAKLFRFIMMGINVLSALIKFKSELSGFAI